MTRPTSSGWPPWKLPGLKATVFFVFIKQLNNQKSGLMRKRTKQIWTSRKQTVQDGVEMYNVGRSYNKMIFI